MYHPSYNVGSYVSLVDLMVVADNKENFSTSPPIRQTNITNFEKN